MIRRWMGLAAATAVLCTLACRDASSPSTTPEITALESRIATARAAGQFEVALDLATTREAAVAGRQAPSWRIADARRDVVTLRRLCALPDSARVRWRESASAAGSARLDLQANPAIAVAALERWESLCELWLGPDAPETATAHSELAAALEQQDQFVRAFELDSLALAIRRRALGASHPDVASSLDRMSVDLKMSDGVSSRTMELCESALEMRRQLLGEDSREYALSLLRRANYLRALRMPKQALSDFTRAEAIFTRTDGAASHQVAEVLTDRGLTLGTFGNWAEAEPILRRALTIRREEGGPPDELLSLVLNQHGVALRELGHLQEAEPVLREAAAVQEQRRNAAPPGRIRARRFPVVAHRDLALLALQRGQWTQAWVELERLSSRIAVDAAIARGELQASPDPWADLLPRVQRALPDSAAMIGWVDSRYGGRQPDWPSWCFVIRKTGPPQWFHTEAPAGNTLPLAVHIRGYAYAMRAAAEWPLQATSTDELERRGREFYRLRMRSMEAALAGTRTLIIASHDTNYGVPVEAMIDSAGRPIAERFVTFYSPSALLYASARERRQKRPGPRRWTGLLVGSPAGSDSQSVWTSLPPLHNATREIQGMARELAAADVFVGRRASEAVLDSLRRVGRLSQYGFIHFATHAMHHNQWPESASLLLAEAHRTARTELLPVTATEMDGYLTVEEISKRWQLHAQLVSLAACRGFSLVATVADGPLGLGSAFLDAGARSLLVSSYTVDDEASELFFMRFSSLLFAPSGRGLDAAGALREARLWLRNFRAPDGSRPYCNPIYWSGYVLVGWPE